MAAAIDQEALSGALRELGLLYGARAPLADTIADARDEAEAIRAYIERERPHLLACYDLKTLVELVRAARGEQGPAFEQYSPKA